MLCLERLKSVRFEGCRGVSASALAGLACRVSVERLEVEGCAMISEADCRCVRLIKNGGRNGGRKARGRRKESLRGTCTCA